MVGRHPNGDYPPIYRLVYTRSAFISGYFHLYSVEAIPRFWSALKIFLDAVPEGVETSDLEKDIKALPNVNSVNQLSIWSMDGLENNAIVHICIKDWEQMMEPKKWCVNV